VDLGVERAQRRKARRQARRDELIDLLRPGQILEPVLAEIEQARLRRQLAVSHVGRGRRDQDLAAIRDPEQPRTAVHALAEVVVVARLGRTGMDRHAHLDAADVREILAAERLLRSQGRRDGIGRRYEGGVERVAGSAEHVPARPQQRLAHEMVVPGHGDPHRFGPRLPALGRALDVGDQESENTARQRLPGARGRGGVDDGRGAWHTLSSDPHRTVRADPIRPHKTAEVTARDSLVELGREPVPRPGLFDWIEHDGMGIERAATIRSGVTARARATRPAGPPASLALVARPAGARGGARLGEGEWV
jgi:hypothetical protein